MRLLVSQLVQRAAAQQMRTMVTEKLQDEIQRGQAAPAGPCDVLFIFALNAESGALTDLLEESQYAKAASFVERSGKLAGKQVVVAEVGVGAEAAAAGTADCLAIHQPKWVVSAGFAGGLVAGMGHARGVIILAASLVGIPTKSYAATQVKRMLTGAGRASKAQMQNAICREFGLLKPPEPPDVADALAIALCHYHVTRTERQIKLGT